MTHADPRTAAITIPDERRADVETLWDYHNMPNEPPRAPKEPSKFVYVPTSPM